MMELAGIAPPQERLQGIRDRFAEGGSTADFLRVLAALGAGLLLMYLLTALAQRRRRRQNNDPEALFHDTIKRLPLSIPQRDLLRKMARELNLEHPTILVLSPQIFHTYARRWTSAARRTGPATVKRIDELAGALFPG